MNIPDSRYGDLYNPPLQHGCLYCGAPVTPNADGTIPAGCDAHQISEVAPDVYRVPSHSDPALSYRVNLAGPVPVCNCPGYRRKGAFGHKHVLDAQGYAAQVVSRVAGKAAA